MTLDCETDLQAWREHLVERVVGEIQETFSQTGEGAFPMRSRHFLDDQLAMYYRCLAPNAVRARYALSWASDQQAGCGLVIADMTMARQLRGKGFLGALLSRLKSLEPPLSHIELENVYNAQLMASVQAQGWRQRPIGPLGAPMRDPLGACWFTRL